MKKYDLGNMKEVDSLAKIKSSGFWRKTKNIMASSENDSFICQYVWLYFYCLISAVHLRSF